MQKKIFLNKNDNDSLKKFKKLYIADKMDYPDKVATKIINYLNSRKEKKKIMLILEILIKSEN